MAHQPCLVQRVSQSLLHPQALNITAAFSQCFSSPLHLAYSSPALCPISKITSELPNQDKFQVVGSQNTLHLFQ